MKANIQALRERRNVLVTEFQNLLEQNKESWDARCAEKCDELNAQIGSLDSQITAHERLMQARALEAVGTPAEHDALREQFTRTPGAHSANSRALRAFLAGGIAALTEEQRRELIARQTPDIRAAMSTTTPSEGGYTTAPEYATQLLEAMKAFGGMREAATRLPTATGTTMNWPATDATAEEGEIVGQNAAVTSGETTFSQKTLDVYKYSSKKLALPFELLQDTFIDLEGYIQRLLATRLARIQNKHFTIGTGTGQPTGVVTAAASGKVGTTGQTLTVTYDDLVDLEHSVDPAYRAGAAWMMNDASVKVLRKLKDSQSRPIFVPGYEVSVPGGAPDTLLGRRIIINQDVAVMAASAKSILFGDFSTYLIRDVMDLTLFRMTDSAFTLNGQVGFVAFMRSGGNLISGGAPIKYYANSAT